MYPFPMAASPPTSSKPPPAHQTPLRARQDELAAAREVIRAEAAVLEHLAVSLDDRFLQALDLIQTCADAGGTVLVAGLGKSGLIGAKISATRRKDSDGKDEDHLFFDFVPPPPPPVQDKPQTAGAAST